MYITWKKREGGGQGGKTVVEQNRGLFLFIGKYRVDTFSEKTTIISTAE